MAKPKKNLRASVCEGLRRLMPDPVREEQSPGGTTLVAGDHGLVAVKLTDESLAVSVYGVRWDGPHTPVPDHRPVGEVAWADFSGGEADAVVVAHLLVQAAIVIRRAAFRRCRHCGKNTPPEWWHGEAACQGCAERHLGIVH